MEHLLKFLSIAVPIAYIGTYVLYARLFRAEREEDFLSSARFSMLVAILLHTSYLLVISAEYHRCPLATRAEGLLFAAWLLAIIHVLNERFTDSQSLGVFTLLPSVVGVVSAALLWDSDAASCVFEHSRFLILHIVLSLASYVAFSVATVLAVMYLIQHRRLKAKRFDTTYRKIPSLDKLDRLAAAWVLAGCIALVLGAALGWTWLRETNREGIGSSLLPIFAVLAIFLASVVTRKVAGWHGIRHMIIIVVGFGLLVVASLFSFLKLHGFYS
jgi:HemX protein